MKENTTFLPRRTLYGALAVTAVLVALGSLVDYPLSSALYDASNPFALFFAAYGAIPAPLGCVAAGTLPEAPAAKTPDGAGDLWFCLDRCGGSLPHHAGSPLPDRHSGGLLDRISERLPDRGLSVPEPEAIKAFFPGTAKDPIPPCKEGSGLCL